MSARLPGSWIHTPLPCRRSAALLEALQRITREVAAVNYAPMVRRGLLCTVTVSGAVGVLNPEPSARHVLPAMHVHDAKDRSAASVQHIFEMCSF